MIRGSYFRVTCFKKYDWEPAKAYCKQITKS